MVERKKGSGRPPKIFTPENVEKLVQKLEAPRSLLTYREAAKEFGCSKSRVGQVAIQQDCRLYKKQYAPKNTDAQRRTHRSLCRNLQRELYAPSRVNTLENFMIFHILIYVFLLNII